MHLVGKLDKAVYECIKACIITVIGENKKRFQQRLRNNEPLYKRE